MKSARRLASVAAFAASLLAAAGCNTYREVEPLGDGERAELSALGSRLAGFRVEIVAETPAHATDASDVAEVLRRAGADVGAAGAAVRVFVGSGRVSPTVEAGEREVFFHVFTLGLWPQTWSDTVEWRYRIIATGGGEESFVETTTRPGFCSWFAGPWALFSHWSFGGVGCRSERESETEYARRLARAVLALARRLAAQAP